MADVFLFTQDEINKTWDRLKNGDDLDGSRIISDGPLKQGLTIPTVATFAKVKEDDIKSIPYARTRESGEATWGSWKETL
jgi:hypothetical protein